MRDYCELKLYGEPPYKTTITYFEMFEPTKTRTAEYETFEEMKSGLHTDIMALSAKGWELVNFVDGVYKFRHSP